MTVKELEDKLATISDKSTEITVVLDSSLGVDPESVYWVACRNWIDEKRHSQEKEEFIFFLGRKEKE